MASIILAVILLRRERQQRTTVVPTGRLFPVKATRNRRWLAFWGGGEGRTDAGPTRMDFPCSLLAESFFFNHAKGVIFTHSLRRCSNSAWSGGETRQNEFVLLIPEFCRGGLSQRPTVKNSTLLV